MVFIWDFFCFCCTVQFLLLCFTAINSFSAVFSSCMICFVCYFSVEAEFVYFSDFLGDGYCAISLCVAKGKIRAPQWCPATVW